MWYYKDKEFTSEDIEDYIGFVYEVTNKTNNMKYIGKKNFYSTTKKAPLKGKKRKRICVKESNWQNYCGSSASVQELVEEHGIDIFKREILYLCKSKGEMSYKEMKAQIENEVLLKPNEYYNAFIGGKIHRSHLKNMIGEQNGI